MWKYFPVHQDEQSAKPQLIDENKNQVEKSPNNFMFSNQN